MYLPNFYHPISEATFNLAMVGGVLLYVSVKSCIYTYVEKWFGIKYKSWPGRER